MFTIVNFRDLVKAGSKKRWNGYKLCYIDEIPETYYDYTPEAKAYQETEEWKNEDRRREEKFRREGRMSSNDPEFSIFTNPILKRGAECQDYPNPQYIPGEQTLFAYFTPKPLGKQWGDDWDDAPYDCNAGRPYDDEVLEVNANRVVTKIEEYVILQVMFYLPQDSWSVKYPLDYGFNTPFCVRDINGGAVAWVYYKGKNYNSCKGAISIHAGCDPWEFMDKVNKINQEIGPYEPND